MTASNLAPVYVNDSRVTLQGDPKPNVSKIIEAAGKQADCEVVRLRSQKDQQGATLNPSDVIDRTSAGNQPVYLKCIDRNDPSSAGMGGRKEGNNEGKEGREGKQGKSGTGFGHSGGSQTSQYGTEGSSKGFGGSGGSGGQEQGYGKQAKGKEGKPMAKPSGQFGGEGADTNVSGSGTGSKPGRGDFGGKSSGSASGSGSQMDMKDPARHQKDRSFKGTKKGSGEEE